MTRAIVLTGTMRRHRFVANAIASRLDVVQVWQEEKSFQPLRYANSAREEAVIERHFAARDESEARYFADHDVVTAPSRRVAAAGCNAPTEIEAMRTLAPDVVLVFGTGLLKQPLIDEFPGRIINLHLGLSPYYRGAGTNFWPLVNGEPQFCGATIHFLDAGVDTGPVIAHVRPVVERGDGPHDVGNKAIVAAADALAAAALTHMREPIAGVPQSAGGRVYKRADFSASAVEQLYANFAGGMIDDYLTRKAERDAKVSLVEMVGTGS